MKNYYWICGSFSMSFKNIIFFFFCDGRLCKCNNDNSNNNISNIDSSKNSNK